MTIGQCLVLRHSEEHRPVSIPDNICTAVGALKAQLVPPAQLVEPSLEKPQKGNR